MYQSLSDIYVHVKLKVQIKLLKLGLLLVAGNKCVLKVVLPNLESLLSSFYLFLERDIVLVVKALYLALI